MKIRQLSFGKKVLLLAVALVTVLQLGTLIPVLGAVRQDVDRSADRSVRLAGIVFDEFMRNRSAQLATTVDVLVADFPFRNAVATGDRATIESVLGNHAARADADTAFVFDLEGNIVASIGSSSSLRFAPIAPRAALDGDDVKAVHGVTFLNGRPFQTVTVPVRAPLIIGWLTLGFPVDDQLAADISTLTDLEASIMSFGISGIRTYASTISGAGRVEAFDGVHLGATESGAVSLRGTRYFTSLRPFQGGSDGLYTALQLPVEGVISAYTRIRNVLFVLAAAALLLAIIGAYWISRMVSRPVQDLAAAARRMREGIYTESINIDSADEFGELAASFNGMPEAISNRERDIFHIAHHDSLSGLPTGDLIVGKLNDAIVLVERLAVINIVLDGLDGIASTLGHGTADQVVRRVAEHIRDMLRPEQLIGHLAPQEFVLVLPEVDVDAAVDLFARIKDRLRAGITLSHANISLQVSAGVSLYPEHRSDAPELLRCAAIARANANHQVTGIGIYSADQDKRALQLIRIVGDFPEALRSGQLFVEYQPKIDIDTQALAGAEALVRWDHPELGRLPPDQFIAAIEQAGGIAHLTRWVLRAAAAQVAAWRKRGIHVPLSVNISVDDLEDEYLPYYLLELTSTHGLQPSEITLEVTESTIMHNVEMSLSIVTCMRELGFRFSIDDFGTGQASLAQLKRIPVDELKIDKSFVQNLSNANDEAIVRASIELAHQFGLEVVAEGVEDAASLARLSELGCEHAQGYFFSESLGPDAFLVWAKKWNAAEGTQLLRLIEQQG
jgi:diguanylate cyclase (GGDEF)-like protein